MRPVIGAEHCLEFSQLALNTQCKCSLSRMQQCNLLTFEHCSLIDALWDVFIRESKAPCQAAFLCLDWGGRVLPHPSYRAIVLVHDLYVSGGATLGTRLRRTCPNMT